MGAGVPEALHSIRSLSCTETNQTPRERMFKYHRRSSNSIPIWLITPDPMLLMNYNRVSKYNPLVKK